MEREGQRLKSETGSEFSWNVMFVCENKKPLRHLPPTLFTPKIENSDNLNIFDFFSGFNWFFLRIPTHG